MDLLVIRVQPNNTRALKFGALLYNSSKEVSCGSWCVCYTIGDPTPDSQTCVLAYVSLKGPFAGSNALTRPISLSLLGSDQDIGKGADCSLSKRWPHSKQSNIDTYIPSTSNGCPMETYK